MPEDFILISIKLAFGAAAAILAIAVWARTREAAWLFVVLGILSFYAELIYSILKFAGFSVDYVTVNSVPALALILAVLSPLFFSIAFIVMLIKKSRG